MDNKQSRMWMEIFEQPEKIKDTLRINTPIIKKIVSDIKQRNIKTVIFAARGSSEHACQVARYLFETKCGMTASIATPSVITLYNGNIDLSNVLTIGVSQSGGAQDVYEFMLATEKQGGLCVSVTNDRNSIMANVGDYRMDLECGEEKSITAAKSYLTQLTLLTAIAGYLSNDQELIDLLPNISTIVDKSLALEPQVKIIVPYLRNNENLLIIGRGLLYGLALETELKIQETCYLDARAYAASDYQHGPIATSKRFVPVLFFIGDPLTDESVIKLHERLKQEHKIFSIIVTNNEQSYDADLVVRINNTYTGMSAVFSCAVFSQMLACLLSIARGYNPDEPKGVSKHTVTR